MPPDPRTGTPVTEQARELVGYVDAANVTDNPTASAHMSPLAGVRAVAEAGIEPTVQLTCRDRNRLAITARSAGRLGARRTQPALSGRGPAVEVGDHPDAEGGERSGPLEMVALARRMRDEGTMLSGAEIADPPRYLIAVADMPLADRYDPAGWRRSSTPAPTS